MDRDETGHRSINFGWFPVDLGLPKIMQALTAESDVSAMNCVDTPATPRDHSQ
jgi:hypothetical protein